MADIYTNISKVLDSNVNYPSVQDISPVNAMLGYSLTLTPQVTSGLPTQPIAITNALVAEVIKAEPLVKENFSYVFGMANAYIPMPRVGRNMFNLGYSMINGVPTYSSIYAFIELLSNANSLILCRCVLESGSTSNPQKLTMRNSTVYERPSFLGIVAGATEAQEVVERTSILGSIDFQNTTIGDNLTNLMGTLGYAIGALDELGNLIGG